MAPAESLGPNNREMDTSIQSTPMRILIVDDEPSVRQVLSELLNAEGHITGEAVGGLEGLAAFQEGDWDMVFTDRVMPEMTGDELAAAIKEIDPGTPVVMITGYVDPATDYMAEPRLIDVVVKKPFTMAAIRNAIGEANAACR